MALQISDILLIYFDFIFLLYLPILKVSYVKLKCLISLNSEGPHFGATNFLLDFIFLSYLLVYSEIAVCLLYTSKKCEFWHPQLRGTPIVVHPNFVKFYLFIFAYSEKFISPR